MIKTVYEFEIYSYKGVETVTAESSYKPLWQLENEIEGLSPAKLPIFVVKHLHSTICFFFFFKNLHIRLLLSFLTYTRIFVFRCCVVGITQYTIRESKTSIFIQQYFAIELTCFYITFRIDIGS